MLKVIGSGMVFATLLVAISVGLNYAVVFGKVHSANYYIGMFFAFVAGWTMRWYIHERSRS